MGVMQLKTSSRFINIILVLSFVGIISLLISLSLVRKSSIINMFPSQDYESAPTSLDHIVFGIASNTFSWSKRRDYVQIWWKPDQMRGCVFLEEALSDENSMNSSSANNLYLPPICISANTSRFRYTYRGSGGLRSAIRVARIVSEMVALDHPDVRWFVFGDDDTIFFPENLVKTLSKYDHGLWYYIGSNSEIYEQNKLLSFETAYGGAGYAISYPLAKVLAKNLDSCLERYPHLYGSDSRISACLAELGVGLTHEHGFHQMDVRGNAFGLLASHPMTPLVSLHHLDHLYPIFPNMAKIDAIQHLFTAVNVDPQRIMQQTVCYDRWFAWAISVSWGYAVQVFPYHMYLSDAIRVEETFQPWKIGRPLGGLYNFNTRAVHGDPCKRQTVLFLSSVSAHGYGIKSSYKRNVSGECLPMKGSPNRLEDIMVLSKKLELDREKMLSPRRQCCDALLAPDGKKMDITIRECGKEELVYMHP